MVKVRYKKLQRNMEIRLLGKHYQRLSFLVQKKLKEHWDKHKIEFPGSSKVGYLRRAQSLAGSISKNVLSKKKKDGSGDIVKYNTPQES